MLKHTLLIGLVGMVPSVTFAVSERPRVIGDRKGSVTYFEDANADKKRQVGEQVTGTGTWYWAAPQGMFTGMIQMHKDGDTGEWSRKGRNGESSPYPKQRP